MKKKGSALILSILMLSFFMTITLTMYYIARNRNKRSIYKIKGMRISSGLDSGSAIAHYELYLADYYVSRGHPYELGTPYYGTYGVDNYADSTTPSATPSAIRYTQEVPSGGGIIVMPITGEHFTGVVLNNYNEYFASYWDPELGTAVPWIAEDKVIGSDVVSRAWLNNTGEKIVRLWTTESAISVGGYRLTNISGSAIGGASLVIPLEVGKLVTATSTSIDLTYEKIVSVSASGIEVENYKITYVESVKVTPKVTPSGSSIVINSDELNSMTVEKLK